MFDLTKQNYDLANAHKEAIFDKYNIFISIVYICKDTYEALLDLELSYPKGSNGGFNGIWQTMDTKIGIYGKTELEALFNAFEWIQERKG